MQPFHVNQVWREKEEEPVKKIKGGEPEGTSSSSPEIKRIEPLPNWEDMFPQRMEIMWQADQRKNKDEYPPNPYRHNIRFYQNLLLAPHLSSLGR